MTSSITSRSDPLDTGIVQRLLEASDELMRSLIAGDRRSTFDHLTKQIALLLRAESCALFLKSNEYDETIVLESSFTDVSGHYVPAVEPLPVHSHSHGGLTGHLAHIHSVVRLTSHDLLTGPHSTYVASPGAIRHHLKSGSCHSLIAVPLFRRNGDLWGLLKAENKKGPNGIASPEVLFDEADENIARLLANKAIVIIESLAIEEEYIRASAFYQSMVDGLKQSVFCKDLLGRYTYVNPRFAARVGRTCEAILGLTDTDLYGNEHNTSTSVQEDDERILRTGQPIDRIESLRTKDGERGIRRRITVPLIDPSGKLVGIQGIMWDDTCSDSGTAQMVHHQALFQTLMDNIPDNIYFKDLQSRFVVINRHLASQFGLKVPEDAKGETDERFFAPQHAIAAFHTEASIIESRRGIHQLKELEVYKDGRERYVLTTKLPWIENNRLIGTFGLSRDIDELVRAQDLVRTLLTAVKQNADPASTANIAFQGLHRIFGHESASVYTFDSVSSTLRGCACFGLDQASVLLRRFEVGPAPLPREKYQSLSEAVFHTGEARFVPDVSQPPCNKEGARMLNLRPGSSAIGLPLKVGSHTLGVLTLYSGHARRQLEERDVAFIRPYADICALAIHLANDRQRIAEQARVNRRFALVAQRFGRICVNPNKMLTDSFVDTFKSAHDELRGIIKNAAGLLRAELGALYLADEPVCVRSANISDLDPNYTRGNSCFTLRAALGFPHHLIGAVSYNVSETSLTASVLRSLRSRTCENVANAPDWSRKLLPVLPGQLVDAGHPRSWMGVPILFEHKSRSVLFGVITFTRVHESTPLCPPFGDLDVAHAETLGRILALALQSLYVARVEYAAHSLRETKKQFEWAIAHETFAPIERAHYILQNLRDPSVAATYSQTEQSALLSRSIRAVCDAKDTMDTLLLAARASSIGRPRALCDLAQLARSERDMVLRLHPTRQVEVSIAGEAKAEVNMDDIARVLRNLLSNAAVHCRSKVVVQLVTLDQECEVHVVDDGPGVPVEDVNQLRKFLPFFRTSSRVSSPGGHGLGLYLAERLVRANGGRLAYQDDDPPGPRFVVALPRCSNPH